MSENSPIKDALYAKIDGMGSEQIHQLLLSNDFSKLFERIYEPVIHTVQDIDEYEKHGTLAESLTHYLFTEMLIPSQRKITFENIELDMIIPNTAELQKDSQNTIIIFFVKTSNIGEIKQKIQHLKKLQKDDTKIWIISRDHIEIPQSIYITEKESFGKFLKDAQNFIKTKKMNKLNIFKTKI
ncbi:hypothetical protein OAJ08_02385 [Candidatus Nitrosopelagicus sp.]|nr:hypothetical protein [Candidatus Nitrosopelagicus sp.]